MKYHVHTSLGGGWVARRDGASRASGRRPTKAHAVTLARGLLRKRGGGELVVHDRAGLVCSRFMVPDRVRGRNP